MNDIVENHPLGYPRLAAFISSHPAFGIFRRFCTLQARIILLHQDRLSEIEAQLSAVDTEEEVQLFLSSRRRDENDRRHDLLAEAEQELHAYGMISPVPMYDKHSRSFRFYSCEAFAWPMSSPTMTYSLTYLSLRPGNIAIPTNVTALATDKAKYGEPVQLDGQLQAPGEVRG
jgi:hypothetical protein